MYSLIIYFGIKKYELSLTIDIGLLHMYHLSVIPPKQHKIPLIVSSQISIPNVSPNLTDAHIGLIWRELCRMKKICKQKLCYLNQSEQIPNKLLWVSDKDPNTLSTFNGYVHKFNTIILTFLCKILLSLFFSSFHIVGFCPLFRLWDFVSWDFVRRAFVLWDSVPDS